LIHKNFGKDLRGKMSSGGFWYHTYLL